MRLIEKLATACAVLAAVVLVFQLMALMVVDVVLRPFGVAVPGALELVTLGTRIVFSLGLPYAALRGAHVSVDLVTEHVPAFARRGLDMLAGTLGAAVCAYAAYAVTMRGLPTWTYGERTPDLGLPEIVNYLPPALGFVLSALVFAGLFVTAASHRPSGGAPEGGH